MTIEGAFVPRNTLNLEDIIIMISSMFSTISIVIMNICIVIIIISSSIATVRAYAESGGSEWGNDIYIYIYIYYYMITNI